MDMSLIGYIGVMKPVFMLLGHSAEYVAGQALSQIETKETKI